MKFSGLLEFFSRRPRCFCSLYAILYFLFSILIFSGCTPSEPKADIVIINGAEPESLDPAIITGQADGRVVRALFEGLTRLDPKTATPAPALAKSWDISADGKTYTFHLRTNAVWSTGEPITVDDVIYSWNRVLDPNTASDYAGQLYYVKNGENINAGKTNPATGKPFQFEDAGWKKINAYTFQVELVGPTPFFADLCAFPTLAVVPKFAIEKNPDRWLLKQPLPTSGPYTLVAWRIHDKIRVQKNPRHWDVANIQNDVVDFIPMESAMTALNIYQSGAADILWDKNLIPSSLMDILGKRADCHKFDYLGTFFMRFNVTKKPFDDVRVRKALALCLDKKRIVEKITKSGEKVATHFVPNGMAVYTPPEGLGYDPELGRKLLAEAGFPNGNGFPTFQYLFKTGKEDEQIGVELQGMWKKELGINMELRAAEWKVYLSEQSRTNYDVSRSSWIGDYNDPNTFLDMFMSNNGNNRTGWNNPRYDKFIREGNLKTNPKEREKILQEAETLLVRDEVPIVPIYYYAGVEFFDSNKIEGIYFNLLDEHPIYTIR